MFIKYNSITNLSDKVIRKVVTQGLSGGEWIALEKIHGANFAFYHNGTDTWTAKRTQIVGGDGSSFFSSNLIRKYYDGVEAIYKNMLESAMIEPEDIIVVYGELFGGHFFGKTESGASSVFPTVNYHPSNEFCVFDIKIEPFYEVGESYYLSYNEMIEMVGDHIPTVPIIARGSFKDVCNVDLNFTSKVPALFGLDGKNSQTEGVVIRPVDGERYAGQHRCIFKHKNEAFVKNSPKPRPSFSIPEEVKPVFEEISGMINVHRIESVISKEGEISWSKFGKVQGAVLTDAKEEYETAHEVDLKKTKVWGQISKSLGRLSAELVQEYFKEHVDDFGTTQS